MLLAPSIKIKLDGNEKNILSDHIGSLIAINATDNFGTSSDELSLYYDLEFTSFPKDGSEVELYLGLQNENIFRIGKYIWSGLFSCGQKSGRKFTILHFLSTDFKNSLTTNKHLYNYSNIRTEDVLKRIASKYGLNVAVDDALKDRIFGNLVQNNISDSLFLKVLSDKLNAKFTLLEGHIVVSRDNAETTIKTNKDYPNHEITITGRDFDWSFKPASDETKKITGVKYGWWDQSKNNLIPVFVGNETGDIHEIYGTNHYKEKEAKDHATSVLHSLQKKKETLEIAGIQALPFIRTEHFVKFKGLSKYLDNKKWKVGYVKHTVTNGKYTNDFNFNLHEEKNK